MYDASGKASDKVSYSLEKSNGHKYIFTLTADSDWINADERVFPVTVDPTVSIPYNINLSGAYGFGIGLSVKW